MSQVLSQTDFYKILKQIRNTAREQDRQMEFSQLKTFFDGISVTREQADELWSFLEQQMILIAHIDEEDLLFSIIPEAEPAGSELNSAGNNPPKASAPAEAAPSSSKQDVSHVNSDSNAIVRELIRRELTRQNSEEDLSNYDMAAMAGARKLASALRPNEMRALVMYWGLEEGISSEPSEIKKQTGYGLPDLESIIVRAEKYLPDRIGTYRKKKTFWDLFRR